MSTGYIYFDLLIAGTTVSFRTVESITVGENETEEFIFLNTTHITTPTLDRTDTLKAVYDELVVELSKPQIVIKQGTTIISQSGEYDFGAVRIGASKDIIFTIENSGKSDMVIEEVQGDKILLSKNDTGYFSMVTESLVAVVAPGAAAEFVIRFSPAAEGSLFTANVQIKTNSQNNADFVFRVKGNGNKVGDTGSVPEGMVLVPAGTYMMGSNNGDSDEKPIHQVTISKPYYMGKYEVTQAEWVKIMGNNPSSWKGDTLPVESVSWNDVVEYCNKRSVAEGLTLCYNESTIYCNFSANGYRLPTEAEWG